MKWAFLIVLGFFLLAALPYKVYAHFSQTDGDMTVTLHVDPNDNPIPGKPANLYFLFDDSGRNFQLSNCICVVSIEEQGKQLYTQQLLQKKYAKPSIWGTNMPYVFPKNDVYHIHLTGKPKSIDSFQPFTLSWYFRVDPGYSGIVQQQSSDVPLIAGVVCGGVMLFILLGWFVKKEIIDADTQDSGKRNTYNKKR